MTKAQHTPGPWAWARSADNGYFSINIHQADDAGETPHSSDVAVVATHFVVDTPAIAEANARLLAAAPELLAALQALLHGCSAYEAEPGWTVLTPSGDDIAAGLRAIAKATDQT